MTADEKQRVLALVALIENTAKEIIGIIEQPDEAPAEIASYQKCGHCEGPNKRKRKGALYCGVGCQRAAASKRRRERSIIAGA